jgi:hypothetical protein
LSETQFVSKLAQINCFLSSGREGNDFALGGTEGDKGGASGSPTHSAVVDSENLAHTGKSIGFYISEAGVGIAIDLARQMRLLARASTPTKGDALAALEIAKDFLGERHVRALNFVSVRTIKGRSS